jgi:hypothetical protein
MSKRILGLSGLLPWPAMALDLKAISRGLVEADPWGKNSEFLPFVLAWLGVIILLALVLKFAHAEYDKWRTERQNRLQARQTADQWLLDVGRLLNVTPPAKLVPGGTPVLWHQYRHQVKQALETQLRQHRELAAQLAEQGAEQ